MATGRRGPAVRTLAASALALAALAALLAQQSGPAAVASSHSAVRSFSASWAAPGGELDVTVVVEGYGAIGQLVETLPIGFTYRRSDQNPAAVRVDDQTVAFTLLGQEEVTYTVAAPEKADRYTFLGVLRDRNRDERPVTGTSTIRIGAAPTPTPTPTLTPSPTPTHSACAPRSTISPSP